MYGQEQDKSMYLELHTENRVDLHIEKTPGNMVFIPMGEGKINWKGLKYLCETAIKQLTD